MAESPWRLLVRDVHEQLDEILTAESRAVPELEFGRIGFNEDQKAPKVVWTQIGGRFTTSDHVITDQSDPPVPVLGVRLAMSQIRIWHTNEEQAEHLLDRLWMATDRVAAERFRWAEAASYEYPSQIAGKSLQSGLSVIVLNLPVWVNVAREFDGEVETVVLVDTVIRTGIESPVGELEADTAYEVNQWVEPDKYSEP
jgi:hypothetical protein